MGKKKVKLSASKITTYQQCPRKYYYRYIKRLPVFDFWSHLIKGNFAHDVLEVWVDRIMKGEDPRDAMQAAFKDTATSENYQGKVEKFLEEIKPWLKKAVFAYEQKHFQPLAVEETVSFRYRNVVVVGRVDRIDYLGPQTIKIVDYKTTKNPNYLSDLQLGIYHIGVKYGSLSGQYGKKAVETSYVLLRHDMRETPYTFTVADLENILDEIEEVSGQIDCDTTWEPKPSNLCQYCDFFVPCTQNREQVDDWWEIEKGW